MTDRGDHTESDRTDFGSDFDDDAIDLALVHADDEYLDLLGGARLSDDLADGDLGEFADEQLTQLLMSWREEVDAEPMPELVDPKLATVTVATARMRKKSRPRLLVPVAAAAAVLAIVFAGVGLAARGAQPGDTLWALTKVLYAEHARSVEAAQAVRADLKEAENALTEGDVAMAKSKLEDAHAALPTVSGEDGKDELEAQHAELVAQLPGNPSGEAGPPPSPDPSTQPSPGTGSGGNSSDPSPTDPAPDPTSPSTPPTDTTDPTTTSPTTETSRNEGSGTSGTNSTGEAPAQEPANEPVNAPAVIN